MQDIKFRAWDTKNKQWLDYIPVKEYMLDCEEWDHHDLRNILTSKYKYTTLVLFKQLVIKNTKTMNQKIKEHVAKYNLLKGYGNTDKEIIETIQESETIHEEKIDDRRWWDDWFFVVEIDGMKIGFDGAKTTGDDSPYDKGWEFDPESICEVEETTETVVVKKYKSIK